MTEETIPADDDEPEVALTAEDDGESHPDDKRDVGVNTDED